MRGLGCLRSFYYLQLLLAGDNETGRKPARNLTQDRYSALLLNKLTTNNEKTMKKLILLGLLFSLLQTVFAQDNYPIPEFDDKPMYFNSSTNSLEKLERQTANVEVKNKYFVIEQYYYFEKKASDFRLKKNQPIQFIFKPAEPNKDIELQLFLFKYTINEKKNQRELQLSSSGVAGSKSMNKNLPYDYKKLDTGLYMISVDELESGEYGLATSTTTYLFGIDN